MPRFTVRDFGSCLKFNGTTGSVTASNSTSLQLTGDYTIMAWIYPSSTGEGGSGRIVTKTSVGTEYEFFAGSNFELALINTASTKTSNLNAVKARVWQHVAATYSDSGDLVSFYVNGVSVGTAAQTTNPTSNTSTLYIGNRSGDDRTFNGLIDEVAIYKNVAMTQAQIQDIYYTGNYPTTNLSALWKFDEGSGTSATDSSGNGNTGTITTATYSTDVFIKPRTAAGSRFLVRDFDYALDILNGTQVCSWGNILATSNSNPITVAFLFNPRSTGSSSYDCQLGYSSSRWFFIYNGASRKLGFNIKISNIEKGSGYPTKNLDLNKWYLVFGLYDPNGGSNNLTCNIYEMITGTLFNSVSTTQTGNIDATAQILRAGYDSNRSLTVNALFDEVMIFSRTLSSTEQQNMAYGILPDLTNCDLYTKFSEGTGTTAADSSGNSRTGTLSGSATWTSNVVCKPRVTTA
jgi:hypothetical protein